MSLLINKKRERRKRLLAAIIIIRTVGCFFGLESAKGEAAAEKDYQDGKEEEEEEENEGEGEKR